MKRALAFLFASAAAAAGAGHAAVPVTAPGQAACQLQIESPIGNWVIQGYDPFGNSPSSATFDLLFLNNGGGQCQFYPRFSTQGEALGLAPEHGGGKRVLYALFDSYGGYDATPIGGQTIRRVTQRPVVIAAHAQQFVRYVLTVATDALPSDGLFSQPLLVTAEDRTGEPLQQHQVNVGIDVLPSAVIGLAGAYRRVDGRADVDLGDLQQGVVQVPLQIYVQSTRGYQLDVHSQNSGHLRLAGTEWEVPYQMVVNGHSIPLSSDGRYTADVGAGLRRDSLPIAFAIGDVADHRAGIYSDVVTVSVSLI